MNLSEQMAARYRKHMGTVLVAVLVVGVMVVGGYAALALAYGGVDRPPIWLVFLPVLPILAIPVVGLRSTIANLRCPSCDASVTWQVARNYSPMGAKANKTCAHCGQRIFGADGESPATRPARP